MMAPKFERLRDLQEVLNAAVYELDQPIDRIEVMLGAIRVTAGAQSVDVRLEYGSQIGEDGSVMPGSPSRACRFGLVSHAPGLFARLLLRLGL